MEGGQYQVSAEAWIDMLPTRVVWAGSWSTMIGDRKKTDGEEAKELAYSA